jgi:sialic acid synthase SpsE
MKIKAGIHEIGDGCKAFIIAEVGSNFVTFEDCKESISAAKQVGADAVKFQLYDHEALYGLPGQLKGQLDPAWLPYLSHKAKAVGIEFMCSAFSPDQAEAVNPYVNIHKVASAELTHVRILEKLRSFGKPVFLSTGASGARDISMALDRLKPTPTVLMYCIASYPANQIQLSTIAQLRQTFGGLVGYSDHSTDVLQIPKWAVHLYKSCVIEKHVTFIEADTPDRPHSLTASQFKAMVESIREPDKLGAIGSTSEEEDMLLRHNRRLIATRDIGVGETLKEGVNFGIFRSLHNDTKALSPWVINEVNGKRVLNHLKAGEGIGPRDIG